MIFLSQTESTPKHFFRKKALGTTNPRRHLELGAFFTSETSVSIYQMTQCNAPEDLNFHQHQFDNIKSWVQSHSFVELEQSFLRMYCSCNYIFCSVPSADRLVALLPSIYNSF
jgi:hypothetical protein